MSNYNVPKGWKLVPVEPTAAMLGAAQTAWINDPLRRTTTLWSAMLAAAPVQPAAQDQEEVQRLREALETIAAYPYSRDQEAGATAMRKVARDALAAHRKQETSHDNQ